MFGIWAKAANVFSSCSSSSSWVITSMSQPTSLEASRTFWPRLPMARDSWSSCTRTMTRPSIGQRITSSTSAGCMALGISICSESFQRMMSIRSPASSSTMLRMRLPRTPTQAPTASMLLS